MRTKRMKLTKDDYKSMERAMRAFKASGLRQQMNEETMKHYKRMSDRGVK